MLPWASTATPSAALVVVAFSSGSGMKYFTAPSAALPMRRPRFQSPCALLTDPDAVVVAVGDEQAAARVHGEPMGNVEVAGTCALLSPGLDELAGLVELHDARIGVAAVAVGDEDVAVR